MKYTVKFEQFGETKIINVEAMSKNLAVVYVKHNYIAAHIIYVVENKE